MPPKRKGDKNADNASASSPAPVKRQRVSRACDQCRSAREKCDGVQPRCYSCASLNRECTYHIAPKKRGVQTGLIRTLESALVWIFESFPGTESALNELLSQEAGREALLIGKGDETANRLHKKWRKSKTHKEIDRLLSGKDYTSPKQDVSEDDDSGTEPDSQNPRSTAGDLEKASVSRAFSSAPPTSQRQFQLPVGCKHLLDVYFAYTHCWLPIVNRDRLVGVTVESSNKDVRDPEMWSALAVASFQDPAKGAESMLFVHNARSLLPLLGEGTISTYGGGGTDDEDRLALRHINSFLLLSLIDLGRDKATTASMLIGLAARMALNLRPTTAQQQAARDPAFASSYKRSLLACFVLDTLVSLRMGQEPHMTSASLGDISPLIEEGPEEWDSWEPLSGFGAASTETISSQPNRWRMIQSLSSFNQMCRFARVLSQHTNQQRGPHSAELAQTLDSRFSFCNSIMGGATPLLPTAFLLQTTFLSATIALTPKPPVSLFWTLMESMENAGHHLGNGASPLFVTLMAFANSRMSGFSAGDKYRWDGLFTKMKSSWENQSQKSPAQRQEEDRTSSADRAYLSTSGFAGVAPSSTPLQTPRGQHQAGNASHYNRQSQPPLYQLMTPSDSYPIRTASGNDANNGTGTASETIPQHPASSRRMTFTSETGPHMHPPSLPASMTSPLALAGPTPFFYDHGDHNHYADHEAILDEFASIDCADSLEADPQFMANLGFAPGSDFPDMRGEFGSL